MCDRQLRTQPCLSPRPNAGVHRLQQEHIAELLAAYLDGEGITARARGSGVNSTIRNHIRRSDIGFRQPVGLSPAQREELELARQYLAGATIKDLSQTFGIGTGLCTGEQLGSQYAESGAIHGVLR